MVPAWLNVLAVLSLFGAFVSALIILLDLCRHPQAMAVMNPVWPVTALYFGPLGLWAYWRLGRAVPTQHHGDKKSFWMNVFTGTTHCGAGCTLGDILAEFLIFLAGIVIASSVFAAQLVLDYLFAFLLGIIFQYYSIVPMRGLKPVEGIKAAVKADFWSLTAFEVGLFAWMALMRFVFFGPALQANNPVYWFMMQIGMMIGFVTAFPMNWVLIRAGVKEPM